ncbi:MAG TPA: zinc ribbon domain-containing protein [Casimicrobiaceae bacterium]|jgi:putative FmdB family regulatory protein
MPIYEYRCSSCGSEHEVLQKISEPLLATCPTCRKDTLTKLVSAAGFQLKGSGWYATDFKNNSKPATKTAAKAEAKADGKADGKGDTATASDGKSSETKSDTKSEAAPSTGCGGSCTCH